MFLLFIGVAIVAAVRSSGSGIFVFAVVNAVASVWANGVLANFRADPQAAPNLAATISMITTLVGVILIVISFF